VHFLSNTWCRRGEALALNRSLCIKPNTHRRRRRDETVELRRVGVGGVYMNSQLTTTAEEFGDVNAADGRDQVNNSAVNAIEVGWRNIWRCVFLNIRISRVV